MFGHYAVRLLSRSSSSTTVKSIRRGFSTGISSETVSDEAFMSSWRNTIPNIEPPTTPLSYMKPRPPIPSAFPSKLTVNFVLPYAPGISNKEENIIIDGMSKEEKGQDFHDTKGKSVRWLSVMDFVVDREGGFSVREKGRTHQV